MQQYTVSIIDTIYMISQLAVAPGSETCVTWDFNLQAWTPRGCTTSIGKSGVITCSCNHLTNFAVLVVYNDTYTIPTVRGIIVHIIIQDICLRQENCQQSNVHPFLTVVSYIGIPTSIVCLIVTIITLTSFK